MLTTLMIGAKTVWNHDAFFDYVDRWMNGDVEGGGSAAGALVGQMWTLYRGSLPPAPPLPPSCGGNAGAGGAAGSNAGGSGAASGAGSGAAGSGGSTNGDAGPSTAAKGGRAGTGTAGNSGSSNSSGSSGSNADAPSGSEGGCGCRVIAPERSTGAILAALGLFIGGLVRRRRRSDRPSR
jgi:MYXO-CTERM domain-containing protein